MADVRVLDQELINQIAAGEVIERPASVVKELLENAVDAGARNIMAEVEGSGIELIRMADDGHGMSEEELRTAVLRHATSKISKAEDLFSIRTLGFRGEALPSILSVSRSSIASRTQGSSAGCRLIVDAGEIVEQSKKGMPVGTVVEVKDLFFNTPARRKFLKSTVTEQRHIIDIISRYCLAEPARRFTLAVNGRAVLNLKEGSSLEERVAGMWGSEVRGKLCSVLEQRPGVSIRGIVASPEVTRPGRSGIYTFVNRRSVMDHTLRAAILEGYSGLIMRRRYPLAVLFIDIEPQEVDVNVHPAKAEVRFRNPSAVFGLVVNAVRHALNGTASYPSLPGGERHENIRVQEPLAFFGRQEADVAAQKRSLVAELQPGLVQQNLFGADAPRLRYAGKSVVGVLHSTYILLEDEGSLYILDQHAAHERVLFERLKNASAAPAPVQSLLSPLIIELSPVEAGAFEEIAAEIREAGIEAEPFGADAVAVRSVPQSLSHGDIRGIVLDLLGAAMEGFLRKKELKQDLLARIACHGSVRAGKRLHGPEIERLLQDLDEAGSPLTCPHGRPLFKRIGKDEIERWIGRRPLS